MSHQRRQHAQHGAVDPVDQRDLPALLECHLLADGKGLLKVCADRGDGVCTIQQHAVFKVQVQAAVVHVDAAHGGVLIVHAEHLGVDKAGGELIDPHAGLNEIFIVGPGQLVDIPLVRDEGGDDAHIDAGFGRAGEGGHHVVVDDEVGRHDIDIALGAGNQIPVAEACTNT